MFWFEIHMTGDENIHKMAKKFDHKTIQVELLRPDMSVIRTEHMTSIRKKYDSYIQCVNEVGEWVDYYGPIRTKIECPPIDIFVKQAIYIESHYVYNYSICDSKRLSPISRNAKSGKMLETDREYSKDRWLEFYLAYSKFPETEIELCLYDNNIDEDNDWMKLYEC